MNGILGSINALVEHQNLKVIIIGDENILGAKSSDYKKIKEKLIRFTTAFEADFEGVFDDIANLYSIKYNQFLQENKKFICELYKKGQHKVRIYFEKRNIRNIILCLHKLN